MPGPRPASRPPAARLGPAPLRQIHRPAKPLYKRAEAQLGEQPSRPVHYLDAARVMFFPLPAILSIFQRLHIYRLPLHVHALITHEPCIGLK